MKTPYPGLLECRFHDRELDVEKTVEVYDHGRKIAEGVASVIMIKDGRLEVIVHDERARRVQVGMVRLPGYRFNYRFNEKTRVWVPEHLVIPDRR